jgi:hypothetical protein
VNLASAQPFCDEGVKLLLFKQGDQVHYTVGWLRCQQRPLGRLR